MKCANCCRNFLWFILIGWHLGLVWILFGVVWCITIIGFPFGKKAFKIGGFIFWPFGKDIVKKEEGTKCHDYCLNFIWIIFSGIPLCILAVLEGVIFYITIIGIPFGNHLLKVAQMSLLPFGRRIVKIDTKPPQKENTPPPTTQQFLVVPQVIPTVPYAIVPPQPQLVAYVPPPQYSTN